jgi:uncharacterized membrane protein
LHMSKKSKSKRTNPNGDAAKEPLRSSPNWALMAFSLAGMILTGYLTFASFSGHSVKGCSAGGGCDVVLTSRWATMFGLPTAFWGFLAYASLAGIAFIKPSAKHWRYAWTAALLGAAYSIYLTSISLTVLKATCPYCLTSLSLMLGTLTLTTFQRPAELRDFAWRPWLIRKIPLAAAFVLALHFQYVVVPTVPESAIARPLADHLTAIGAKFYGASWCEHCQQQKKFFGKAANRLPYVECKAGGPDAPLSYACAENYISTFPTWVIKDRRIEGVLGLSELAELSGFTQTAKDD